MARPRRPEAPGRVFHVFARGNNRRPVFLDDEDRHFYLLLLAEVIRRHGWRVLAWCLMGNHVHLVVETPDPNLGDGMQRLQGFHANRFNQRHGCMNHVWGGRFQHVVIESDGHLWTAVRYVLRNPLEAQLVANPIEYPWSSHARAVAGSDPHLLDRPRLLELFSADGGDPMERYRRLVEAGATQASVAS